MSKSRNFLSILIPSATVFFSSGCIMVLELVAGRLIARHLGSSLYTWTAVIGVVLAGITIGNYLGGRIADRFPARKALAVLFGVSSVACVMIVILNNIVGEWIWLWQLSWPVRVFSHVSLVFLLPSILLGTISPVVAKMALDRGLATGRTVGDIYAWGAAGSIMGTFLTGFYLIAVMGTIAIIWTVGVALLLMAILYWARLWVLYLWAAIFIALMTMGMAPLDWARDTGASLSLREEPNPNILYEDETPYCYVAVKRISETVDKRAFMQDKLMHSKIIMGDINNLQYFHTIIFAAITHGLSENVEKLSAMHIGGGGYVFPRYIEENWPGSRNDVAEIDSRITEAAMQAFGLSRDTPINTITMDARNYVDELLRQERNGGPITRYDFIYEDAFSDYSVPYQLVTKEFNDKIFKILTDDGVYMINSIDAYNSARFLGSYVNTLEQTFPYVYVIAEGGPHSNRKIFVLIASKREMEPEKLTHRYKAGLDFWYLNDSEMETIRQRSRGILMTDDYVPVENMLAPVVQQSAIDLLAGKYREQAKELKRQGKLEQSIAKYEELIKLDPTMSILAFNEIAFIQAKQGNLEAAAGTFRQALEYNERADFKDNMANIHVSLGTVLKQLGRSEQSTEHYKKGIEGYRTELAQNPDSLRTWVRLGDTLATIGNFNEASVCFSKAIALNPAILANHIKLVQSLEFQGRYDEAITALKKAISLASHYGRKESIAQLERYLELVEFRKSKQTTK
ncbi:MAG TPA: tetratricopeptide repeat protein [Phycisphaerales bacterium]|nr:tetratricopeptide repeat protein [Phycisphaerales bacterium]